MSLRPLLRSAWALVRRIPSPILVALVVLAISSSWLLDEALRSGIAGRTDAEPIRIDINPVAQALGVVAANVRVDIEPNGHGLDVCVLVSASSIEGGTGADRKLLLVEPLVIKPTPEPTDWAEVPFRTDDIVVSSTHASIPIDMPATQWTEDKSKESGVFTTATLSLGSVHGNEMFAAMWGTCMRFDVDQAHAQGLAVSTYRIALGEGPGDQSGLIDLGATSVDYIFEGVSPTDTKPEGTDEAGVDCACVSFETFPGGTVEVSYASAKTAGVVNASRWVGGAAALSVIGVLVARFMSNNSGSSKKKAKGRGRRGKKGKRKPR